MNHSSILRIKSGQYLLCVNPWEGRQIPCRWMDIRFSIRHVEMTMEDFQKMEHVGSNNTVRSGKSFIVLEPDKVRGPQPFNNQHLFAYLLYIGAHIIMWRSLVWE